MLGPSGPAVTSQSLGPMREGRRRQSGEPNWPTVPVDGSPPLTSGYIILGIISFQSQRPQRPGQADPIKSIPERENIPHKLAMIHFFFNLLLGHDDLLEWHVTIQVVHVFVVATQYQGS